MIKESFPLFLTSHSNDHSFGWKGKDWSMHLLVIRLGLVNRPKSGIHFSPSKGYYYLHHLTLCIYHTMGKYIESVISFSKFNLLIASNSIGINIDSISISLELLHFTNIFPYKWILLFLQKKEKKNEMLLS